MANVPVQSLMPFLDETVASGDYLRLEKTDNALKLYQQAAEKWGDVSQILVAAEECIELALALHHILRIKKVKALDQVHEEIADVEIMLAQVRILLSLSENKIAACKAKKLRRLKRLLKEAKE